MEAPSEFRLNSSVDLQCYSSPDAVRRLCAVGADTSLMKGEVNSFLIVFKLFTCFIVKEQ